LQPTEKWPSSQDRLQKPVIAMTGCLPTFPLSTKRLVLRPLGASDRDEFVRMHHASHAFFEPWSPAPGASQTMDDIFQRQLQRSTDGLASGREIRLCAFLHDGNLAGMFNLNEIVRGAFQNAYAGWKVSVEHTRQGIGTEAVNAILAMAYSEPPEGLGLHRVQANILPANTASIRLAEKTGFRREGIAKRYLKIAGRWQDHLMFAKLAEEHLESLVPTDASRGK
jgi:ribosomal-protein-alanine N-acetyltransferase